MNTAAKVDSTIQEWKAQGWKAAAIVVAIARACIGWPYVFGARGQYCTPSNRRSRARDDHPTIKSKCQVLNGEKSGCTGCKWYPGGVVRFFDCRGFTYWVFKQIGYTIAGAGATSQYDDNANWSEKGLIANMPRDMVCIVFKDKNGTKEHTGIHIGDGQIIHCSNGVQTGKITDKGWTHYALVKGFDGRRDGGEPVPDPDPIPEDEYPTIRRGSKGEAVTKAQRILQKCGYDLGSCGVDGDFGRATETAVKRFQVDHGLTADGVVGAATWAAMRAADGQEKPEIRYRVTISGLTEAQAAEIVKQYDTAKMEKE